MCRCSAETSRWPSKDSKPTCQRWEKLSQEFKTPTCPLRYAKCVAPTLPGCHLNITRMPVSNLVPQAPISCPCVRTANCWPLTPWRGGVGIAWPSSARRKPFKAILKSWSARWGATLAHKPCMSKPWEMTTSSTTLPMTWMARGGMKGKSSVRHSFTVDSRRHVLSRAWCFSSAVVSWLSRANACQGKVMVIHHDDDIPWNLKLSTFRKRKSTTNHWFSGVALAR